MINEPEANQEGLIANGQDNSPYHKKTLCKDNSINDENYTTHSLSLTSTNGNTKPTPRTKLKIFATSVSHPARTNAPPKSVDPIYPDDNTNPGLPPSTIVAPPTCGSMVILSIRPPDRIACKHWMKPRVG